MRLKAVIRAKKETEQMVKPVPRGEVPEISIRENLQGCSRLISATRVELRCEKQALRSAIQNARAELCQQWRVLREPPLKEAEQLIKKILKIDDYEAAKLAERVHLFVDLDYVADCNRGEACWAYANDLVRLAQEVEERFAGLESYVSSPIYINRA
jgi:hypothetical protein